MRVRTFYAIIEKPDNFDNFLDITRLFGRILKNSMLKEWAAHE